MKKESRPAVALGDVNIEISKDPAKEAGKYISDILGLNFERPTLLMLAGGSSRGVLSHINKEYIGPHITVTVTDERFTDDIEENNFAFLQGTSFYNELVGVDAYCIDTQIYGDETLTGHAERFEKNIHDWKNEFPKGIIIGLFGIGSDGHTAGIIPGVYEEGEFKKKFDGERWVAHMDLQHADIANTAKYPFPQRVTVTFPFMRIVDFPVFFVCGEEKREALKRTLEKKGSLAETPARIIKEMKNPYLFTDIETI